MLEEVLNKKVSAVPITPCIPLILVLPEVISACIPVTVTPALISVEAAPLPTIEVTV